MVSWDLEAKFLGVSPNIKELVILAKEERFSNIESIQFERDEGNDRIFILCVNDRGLNQTKFKAEKIKDSFSK